MVELNELQTRLDEAKARTAEAEKALAEVKAETAKIEALDLNVEPTLSKSKEVVVKIKKNLKTIQKKEDELNGMCLSLSGAFSAAEMMEHYALHAETVLRLVHLLASRGRYNDALRMLEELKQPILDLDFGLPLKFQRVAKAIYDWNKADLYAKKGEREIKNGDLPLSAEEMDEYGRINDSLVVSLRDQRAKDYHLDKRNGFLFVTYAMHEKEVDQDKDSFLALQPKRLEIDMLGENMSQLTRERANEVIKIFEDEYNKLSTAAFEEQRNYEEALFYFQNKAGVKPEHITHKAFREAENETEFRFYFLEAEALKKTEEEFAIDCRALVVEAKYKGDFPITLLAHYLALPELPSEKLQLLMRELSHLTFERLLYVIGKAMEIGLDEPRQALAVDTLITKKKKRGNLEDMAEYLVLLNEKLEETQKAKFASLLKGMIRSPRARKVITKSQDGNVHALRGEDKENFVKPLGKKMKNTNVKYWDVINKFLYVALAVIMPLLVCAAGFVVLHFVKDLGLAGKFLYLAPFVIGFVAVNCVIFLRFGRDERGSEIARRLIGLDALWKAVLGLLFFILPTQLSFFAPYGYFLLISSALEGFWGFLVFKDRRKVCGFLFYLPTLLCTIASVVFIILDLMKGLI